LNKQYKWYEMSHTWFEYWSESNNPD